MKNKKAKLITGTGVAGQSKNRWECPYCRENKEPECRFNLGLDKINIVWKCRFCKNKLLLEEWK